MHTLAYVTVGRENKIMFLMRPDKKILKIIYCPLEFLINRSLQNINIYKIICQLNNC